AGVLAHDVGIVGVLDRDVSSLVRHARLATPDVGHGRRPRRFGAQMIVTALRPRRTLVGPAGGTGLVPPFLLSHPGVLFHPAAGVSSGHAVCPWTPAVAPGLP